MANITASTLRLRSNSVPVATSSALSKRKDLESPYFHSVRCFSEPSSRKASESGIKNSFVTENDSWASDSIASENDNWSNWSWPESNVNQNEYPAIPASPSFATATMTSSEVLDENNGVIKVESSSSTPISLLRAPNEAGIADYPIFTLREPDLVEDPELLQDIRNRVLSLITNKKNVEYAGAGGKIFLKLGGKDACKIVYKQLGLISKQSGKRFAKNIPVISFVAGVGLACSRFYSAYNATDSSYRKAECVKGFSEIFSGAFSCFPGVGTAVSVMMDVGILAHDGSTMKPLKSLNPNTVEESYELLGLSMANNPSKADVDRAFRYICLAIHPDTVISHGTQIANAFTEFQVDLIRAKDKIYEHNDW